VNNLSLELLTLHLLPKMAQTAEKFNSVPRVVFVSSDFFHAIKLDANEIPEKSVHEVLAAKFLSSPYVLFFIFRSVIAF
jgi:hypothetical protein